MNVNMFRVAREASAGWNVTKTLSQMLILWCIFLFAGPWFLTWVERSLGIAGFASDAGRVIGLMLFIPASIVAVWSAVVMAVTGAGTPLPVDCARHLVIRGPYRCIRNPMALVAVLQAGGVALWFGSWFVLACAIAGGVAWNTVLRPREEVDLVQRFGAPYERYREHVRCWIPRIRPYDE